MASVVSVVCVVNGVSVARVLYVIDKEEQNMVNGLGLMTNGVRRVERRKEGGERRKEEEERKR